MKIDEEKNKRETNEGKARGRRQGGENKLEGKGKKIGKGWKEIGKREEREERTERKGRKEKEERGGRKKGKDTKGKGRN